MTPYVRTGPFTDYVNTPGLSAEWANAVENALIGLSGYIAPPPSGDTTGVADQGSLNPLFAASAATGLPVFLQPGTYYGNFLLPTNYEQPIIRGAGKSLTTVQAASSASAVFKFRGGSGRISGGRLEDLTLAPAGAGVGIGVELAGACGVQVRNVRFSPVGFAINGLFHNDIGSNFTEYCLFEDCEFWTSTTGQAITYQVDNGVESFHGTGLRGSNVINVPTGAVGPIILINTTAFPYQAPLSFDVFPGTASNVVVVQNNSGGRAADFYGSIRVETYGAGTILAWGYPVYLAGSIHQLASTTGTRLGTLLQVEKTTYNPSTSVAQLRRQQFVTAVTNAATAVTPNISNGAYAVGPNLSAIIQVTLYGAAGYNYVYQLLCWQSPYNSSGNVQVLANPEAVNSAGYGAPTFGWNNGLTITNSSYPASGSNQITAFVDVLPFGTLQNPNILPQ